VQDIFCAVFCFWQNGKKLERIVCSVEFLGAMDFPKGCEENVWMPGIQLYS
jgi:hypothetical protein